MYGLLLRMAISCVLKFDAVPGHLYTRQNSPGGKLAFFIFIQGSKVKKKSTVQFL